MTALCGCQLLSLISLVPQEVCERSITALLYTHTYTSAHTALKLLIMRAKGKTQAMESEKKAAAFSRALWNKHEDLLSHCPC